MLLSDFSAINEIDSEISLLHKQLESLYEVRAKRLGLDGANLNNLSITDYFAANRGVYTESWAQKEYQRLQNIWEGYGIKIPSLSVFNKKLQASRKLIEALSNEKPELNGNLTVILVPPSKLFSIHKASELLMKETFTSVPAFFDMNIGQGTRSADWRLMIAYKANEGLNFGSAKNILQQKDYLVSGHDLRGLGVIEYLAFALQNEFITDTDTCTLLLRNYKKRPGQLVPSVSFRGGQHRFEIDEEAGLFGDERFRPALEVV